MSAGGGGPGGSLHYSFTLPAGDGENNGANSGPSPTDVLPQQSRSGQARILALDTDPVSRSNVRNMLLEAGFITVVTGDPDSVDHLVGAERPHLVLVDMTLDGGEGFEIVERIGRISDAPVIFMIGNGTGPDMDRAFDLGVARLPSPSPSPRRSLWRESGRPCGGGATPFSRSGRNPSCWVS